MSCYQKNIPWGNFSQGIYHGKLILVQIYCYAVARLVTELSLLLTWYLE